MFLCLSFVLPGPAATEDGVLRIPIKAGAGGAPEGWEIKQWRGKAQFEVFRTDASEAIHLKSDRSSGALYRDVEFDIRDKPILHWKWKAVKLPEGADVRVKRKDDQAIQLYVIFPKWPSVVNSRVLGYIWDTTAPKDAFIPSTKSSKTRYVVIRSGPEGLGRWFSEERNVYDDYRKSFNEEPPGVGRVSVMIDSDDMGTTAESYISGIYFSRPGLSD
ncbi:MAG: DUF3047 domain-containing protein [Thermodesulfobacteriota bacterium]